MDARRPPAANGANGGMPPLTALDALRTKCRALVIHPLSRPSEQLGCLSVKLEMFACGAIYRPNFGLRRYFVSKNSACGASYKQNFSLRRYLIYKYNFCLRRALFNYKQNVSLRRYF